MSSSDKGIDSKVEVIESLLCVGSMDFCVVGIWGLGGMGKTTLARATFNKIFSRFDDAYFIENIREESSEKDPQLLSLTYQLSSATLREETVELLDGSARLPARKNLLIVFDNVTNPMQIESIIGPLHNWLNTGCKFIVTTREKQVLQYCCSEEKIYKLNELSDNEALQLFSRYAFKKKDPPMEFEAVSKKVVEYTKGIPLALIIFGNFLYGKTKQEWESVMGMLDQNLSRGTQKVLKTRHDGEGGDIIKSGLDSEKIVGEGVKEVLNVKSGLDSEKIVGEGVKEVLNIKSGLDSEKIVGEGVKEVLNLVELIKSDALDYQKRNILDASERLGSGSTVVNVIKCRPLKFIRSDAESSSQQGNPNPGTDHEMPDISVAQGGNDEQMISHDNETTQNEAKKWTGIPKWLGKSQRPSLTSQSKSSITEELREIIKNQELQLTRKDEQLTRKEEQLTQKEKQLTQKEKQLTSMQEQVTRKDEQLAEASRRSDELAQMILNFNSTCQRMEDFMRHYGNDPPPPPPSTGSGSAMIS